MQNNPSILAKMTRAFDQAAHANGGHYKAQPTPPPRTYADRTTAALTQALTQLMQTLGTLPPTHATAVWGEAAKMQAALQAQRPRCDTCHTPLTPAEQAEAQAQPDCYRTCGVCQEAV
jgi:hypothetical protein